MSKRTLAITCALVLAAGALFLSPAFAADSGVPAYLTDGLAECQAQQKAAKTLTEQAWAETCVNLAQRAVDDYVAAHPVPTATASPTATTVAPTPSPTTPPATTPPVTTPPATTPPPTTVPPTSSPASSWPDATNTGVPAGTTLTAYAGPCTITAANTVIDAKTITCSTLTINATGVTITRSRLTGTGDPQIAVGSGSLTISDSTLAVGLGSTGIQDRNWSGLRLNIAGGNRGAYCASTCTLRDSWVHGTRINVSQGQHASGIRAEQYTTYDHNSLSCDLAASTDACSADVTMYADFAPVHDVRITNNLMVASPSATFCAYGGTSGGKPFSNDPTNATNIVFTGNVFQRGTSGHCAGDPRGTAIASFDKTRSGNVWTLNVYDDGAAITV